MKPLLQNAGRVTPLRAFDSMRPFTMLLALPFSTSVMCAPACTELAQRQGLRQLIKALTTGTDADINAIPLASNVTVIMQTQGIRVTLAKDLQGARNAARTIHRIVTRFGPAPNDIASYLDNGVDEAFVNGTLTLGLTASNDVRLPLVTVPAAQNLVYDTTTCLGYYTVGTLEPVDGVIETALDAFLIDNFPLYEVLDNVTAPILDKQTLESIASVPARVRHASLYGVDDVEKSLVLQSLRTAASLTVKVADKIYPPDVQQSSQAKTFMPLVPPTVLCFQPASAQSVKTLIYLTNLPHENQVDSVAGCVSDLRSTDSILFLTDFIIGEVTTHMKAMLLQAVTEQVKPSLVIGKMNQMIEAGYSQEKLYQTVLKLVDDFNAAIKDVAVEGSPMAEVSLPTATVVFGSTEHGWGFTLEQVAERAAPSLGMSSTDLLNKLWGDWYYQPDKKQWSQECKSGDKSKECGFNRFELGVELTKEEQQSSRTKLIQAAMGKYSPLSYGVLKLLLRLPDPVTAQRNRVQTLLEPSGNNATRSAAQTRDYGDKAPLLISVTKSVILDGNKSVLLGRVYSGRAVAGVKVQIRGWTYGPDSKQIAMQVAIGHVYHALGPSALDCSSMPAGNLVYLADMGTCPPLQSGTISGVADAPTFKSSVLTSIPVLDSKISPSSAGKLSQLKDAIQAVKKSYPEITTVESSPSSDFTISGPRDRYIRNALQHLANIVDQQSLTLGRTTVRSQDKREPFYSIKVLAPVGRESALQSIFSPQRGELQESEPIAEDLFLTRWNTPVATFATVQDGIKRSQGIILRMEFEEWQGEPHF
ncbi:hypothetical protein M409DRAFT_23056 [Zasmidium cellare ATCC 36951]|uniref:Uncharacterized protein n=1 Tax=Zasmidium cellare ATCC 36951 TaxID=1080233 RepID=A0A6A6CLV5_ZASCE|nr:uncharacterized protein M409DRAFT_23056 [Zasmidium cellare ATCC 36951]KAF2166416.1 hypothetical protein M409DRAFT_23056 [Zasmidium cellare ATCC 36951]